MSNRSRDEFYDNVLALKYFQEENPFIVDQNQITRFVANVFWKRSGFPNLSENGLTVHWNFGDFNGPSVTIDTQRVDCHAELFHGQFSPNYQFYTFDREENVLRIRHEQGLYEVIVTPIRGRDD